MTTTIRTALTALLAALVALGGVAPAGAVAGFGDVDADSFYAVPVQWMVDEDITTGVSSTCFAPERIVTRGEGIVFLWRLDGERWGKRHSFDDITADWMVPAVKWGERKDIITGIAPGIYGPDLPMTRAQFLTMLWRYARSPEPGRPASFVDLRADWYLDAVAWSAEEGITEGVGAGRFAPDRPLTRGEAATFLYRFADPRKAPRVDKDSPACGGAPSPAPPAPSPSPPSPSPTPSPVPPEPSPPIPIPTRSSITGAAGLSDPGALTVVNGDYRARTAGAVVENLDIRGVMRIEADNVTVRNVRVTGSSTSYVIGIKDDVQGTVIEDCEAHAVVSNGVIGGTGRDTTVRRCLITGFADGIKAEDDSLYERNYIRLTMQSGSGKHLDGIQGSGDTNWTVRENVIEMPDTFVTDGVNAAIFAQAQNGAGTRFDLHDIRVERNWIFGGSYAVRLTGGSNLHDAVFHDNVFQGGSKWGDALLQPCSEVSQRGNVTASGGAIDSTCN